MPDSVPAPVPPAVPPPVPSSGESSARPGSTAEPTDRKRAALGRLVPRGKGARWAAAGAAVVIVGGAAVAVAVVDHHHDRVFGGPRMAWSVPGHEGGFERGPARPGEPGQVGPGERGARGPGDLEQRRLLKGDGRAESVRPDAAARPDGAAQAAPAPLPALAIGAAAEKAAAAVTGGKVEAMRVVAQEGGGSAWRAVVLGPDGVRHAVTVSGADGTVTSNTTIDR
ncbi:hypothetical protein ACFWUQ_23195 [Streptomyces sp. NPDC058662]|uniref:hypothetical protein n=1 Tax=Streptomyces sp. NPDC058662 TaxID=3346583 RepID=UPI003654B167